MPLVELQQWAEYAAIEPFGGHYDDLRAGSIAAAVYNVNRDPKARREPFTPLDFMPWNALSGHTEPATVTGAELTAAEHTALIDAELFGVAPKGI